MMFLDDEEATARIRTRRTGSSLWVAVTALAACVIMIFALVDTAAASDLPTLSQVVAPPLLLDGGLALDHRFLYAILMILFTIAAAGLWHLSFRTPARDAERARNHGGHVSRS